MHSAALRACLRREEGALFYIPGTYDLAWAQETAPMLDRRAGLLSSAPYRGWCFADSNVTAPIFIRLEVGRKPTGAFREGSSA
jgi:hypothetical protein